MINDGKDDNLQPQSNFEICFVCVFRESAAVLPLLQAPAECTQYCQHASTTLPCAVKTHKYLFLVHLSQLLLRQGRAYLACKLCICPVGASFCKR
jgi:hypothetical protein